MFTLDSFEKQINATILKRGKDYFNNGFVTFLEEIETNIWQAEVSGSEDYDVRMVLDSKNLIKDTSCDCPYDDDVCKHVAAVCYAIRKEKGTPKTKPQKSSVNVFEKILSQLSLEECLEFIRQYASQDKNFKIEVELFFATKDANVDVEEKYSSLIQKLIKKHSDRGFIDYQDSKKLAVEFRKLIGNANQMLVKKNYRDAFLFAKSALKEQVEIMGECDDSSGALGGAFCETIELLDEIVQSDAAMSLKQQIFDFLIIELAKSDYFDYGDFGYELFKTLQTLAVSLGYTEEFIQFMDKRIEQFTGKNYNYEKEFFIKSKIKFYQTIGKNEQARLLMVQNLHFPDIREQEIVRNIEYKNYNEAKSLIQEGIKLAQSEHYLGLISRWKGYELQIAVLENDTNNIRRIASDFAFDRSVNITYYQQWKNTYSETEFRPVIEKHIANTIQRIEQETEKKRSLWKNYSPISLYLEMLAPIYVVEQYWDRLLQLMQQGVSVNTLLNFQKYLTKVYPKEIFALYLPALQDESEDLQGRGQYKEFVRKILKVLALYPESKPEIIALANKLATRMPRRPALIEELGKVLKMD